MITLANITLNKSLKESDRRLEGTCYDHLVTSPRYMDLVARIIMSVRYVEVTVRVIVRRDLLRYHTS